MPPRLERALEAFETGELDLIVRRGRPEDFEALRALVSMDADPDHRQRAIYALGKWGKPEVVPDIVAVLPGIEEAGRVTAVEALRRLGTPAAEEAIVELAEDPSVDVRKYVVRALRRRGDEKAERTLRRIADRDPEEWIRSMAEQAMRSAE